MIDFTQATANSKKKILFCEPEPRIIEAAIQAKKHGLQPQLVGDEQAYRQAANNPEDINDLPILPIDADLYAQEYYELRKHKEITLEDAKKTLLDPAFFSCMHLRAGAADGLVAGASWPTSNTLRPALQTLREGHVSSYFLMHTDRGVHLFADCAMNIQPTKNELVQIAINTAQAAEQLGLQPRVAMLSFSTKGSASHANQERVMHATTALKQYVKQEGKDWVVSGEYQVDAALNQEVASSKAPDEAIQGDANVLIFPDLDAGNIGYKLVQQYSQAQAVGPILAGLNKPVNDLSRGASSQEIFELAKITAWQSNQ